MHQYQQRHIAVQNDQLFQVKDLGANLLTSVNNSFTAIIQVKDTLLRMALDICTLQSLVQGSISLRSLDPTKELPVIIEDALGKQFSIPAEWIEKLDWNVRSPSHYNDDFMSGAKIA